MEEVCQSTPMAGSLPAESVPGVVRLRSQAGHVVGLVQCNKVASLLQKEGRRWGLLTACILLVQKCALVGLFVGSKLHFAMKAIFWRRQIDVQCLSKVHFLRLSMGQQGQHNTTVHKRLHTIVFIADHNMV